MTVKEGFVSKPKHPLRVVLDSHCRTPPDARVLKYGVPTLIACTTHEQESAAANELRNPVNMDVVGFPVGERGGVSIPHVLELLERSGIERVMVEGGSSVIASFFESGCVDEYSVFVGNIIIGGKDSPTPAGGKGAAQPADVVGLELVECRKMKGGVLLRYRVGK